VTTQLTLNTISVTTQLTLNTISVTKQLTLNISAQYKYFLDVLAEIWIHPDG
jgi:hypothetical protein